MVDGDDAIQRRLHDGPFPGFAFAQGVPCFLALGDVIGDADNAVDFPRSVMNGKGAVLNPTD